MNLFVSMFEYMYNNFDLVFQHNPHSPPNTHTHTRTHTRAHTHTNPSMPLSKLYKHSDQIIAVLLMHESDTICYNKLSQYSCFSFLRAR